MKNYTKTDETERIEIKNLYTILDNTGHVYEAIGKNPEEAYQSFVTQFAARGLNFFRDTLPSSFREVI